MTVAAATRRKKRPGCAAVVLTSRPEDRRVIAEALEGWDVDFRDREREVLPALRTTGAPLFITYPDGADEPPLTALIRGIRDGAPAFDVVALRRPGATSGGALIALTRLGLADVIVLDDPAFVQKLRELVWRTRLKRRVAACGRRAAADLPPKIRRLVHWSFHRGLRCNSVSEFAAANGISNQNLRERLARFNLTPEDLLRWRRVIAAFVLFEHTLLTVKRVARRLGFSSATALHNAIRRATNTSRTQLLKAGGTEYLIATLRKQMGVA